MKNIKMLLESLALAAILGVNGYMAVESSKASELTLMDVDALGDGEDGISYDAYGYGPHYGTGHEDIFCKVYSGFASTGGSFEGASISILGCGGGYNYTPSSSTNYTFCEQTVKYDRKYCTKGSSYSCETDPRDCASLFAKYGLGKAPGEL